MERKMKMQAPEGTRGEQVIDGHGYNVPQNGVITVMQETHLETLQRHGFILMGEDDENPSEFINNAQDKKKDKQALVTFIEERGGEADVDMKLTKLQRLAREAAGIKE